MEDFTQPLVKLKISNKYQEKLRIVEHFNGLGLFRAVNYREDYFYRLSHLLSINSSIKTHIKDNSPLLNGHIPLEIKICEEKSGYHCFPYDELFESAVKDSYEHYMFRLGELIKQNSGFMYFKRYVSDFKAQLQLADAYFILKDYKNAYDCYNITRGYADYVSRMKGICGILLGKESTEPFAVDAYILCLNYNSVHKISRIVEPSVRDGLYCLLAKNIKSPRLNIFIKYALITSFSSLDPKLKTIYSKDVINYAMYKTENGLEYEKNVWKGVLNVLKKNPIFCVNF